MATKSFQLDTLFNFILIATVVVSSVASDQQIDQQAESVTAATQSENSSESVEVLLEDDRALNSTLENVNIDANTTIDSLVNETTTANTTIVNKKFTCLLEDNYQEKTPTFQIVNGTVLLSNLKQNQNVTSRNQPATCHLVLFFAPWCPFSIQAAPHLNALPRGFPMLSFYAIDAHIHNSLSTMQGVMAIPSLFLFHNGKPAARYNETEYQVDLFASFITRYTGIPPVSQLNRTSADYVGPLPTSVVEVTDPWLILAWAVLFLSLIYWFTRSNLFWTLIENIRNTWREAEAQHQHAD